MFRHNIRPDLIETILQVANGGHRDYQSQTMRFYYRDGTTKDHAFYVAHGHSYDSSQYALVQYAGAEDHSGPIYPDITEVVVSLHDCYEARVIEREEWDDEDRWW